MKTKIGTEVAHVTRDSDSDTAFKVKKSKVQDAGMLWRPPAQLFHSLLSQAVSYTTVIP